jgi:hypothetical protein
MREIRLPSGLAQRHFHIKMPHLFRYKGPAVRLSWTQLPHECRQTVGLRRHFDGTSNVPEKKTRLNRERPRHLVTMFGVGISPFYQPIRRSPIP